MGKSVRDILRETVEGAGYSQSYLNKLYEGGLTASSALQHMGGIWIRNCA